MDRENVSAPRGQSGQYAYEGIDRAFHEKARLGIMISLLAVSEGRLFSELKHLCDLTEGNLSRHLQILEDGRFIEIEKRFQNKRPQTICRLTPHGRKCFLEYLEELERALKDAKDNAFVPVRINCEASVG